MSIDPSLEKRIKEKLENLEKGTYGYQNQNSSHKKLTWSPDKKAENVVRFISYPHDKDEEFIDAWFHFAINGKHLLCLERNYGEDCPACSLGRSLAKTGNLDDKELGKKLFPKQRFYAALVDRNDAEPYVRYWGFNKNNYNFLLKKLIDPDYCNYLDIHEGLDATITVHQPEGQLYAVPQINGFKRKESPLAATDKEIKRLLSETPKFEEVYIPMSFKEMKDFLDNWISAGEFPSPEEKNDEVVKGGNSSEQEKEKSEQLKELDASFNDALDDL